jgi:iron complex outermembrane receptor protein
MGLPLLRPLAAAETQGESSGVLEEIVVTAEKRAATVQETPVAVSALTGNALALRRIDSLQDIQQSVPGLVVSANTSFGQPYIRGVGNEILAGLNDSAVATHLDGVYIPREPNLLFDFYDLNRVEVLRGPQGTLYGRNATGGAINIITNEPTFQPEANLGLTVGNFNDRRVTAAASNGLIPGSLAVRGALLVEGRDGFQKNLFDGVRLDNKSVVSGRLSVKYLVGDWSFLLRGDYTRDNSRGVATREVSGNPALAPVLAVGGFSPTGFYDVNVDSPTSQHIRAGGVNLTAHMGDAQFGVTSITGWRSNRLGIVLDQDATQIPALLGNTEDEFSTSISEELQLAGTVGNLEYIAGVYYFREQATDHYHFQFGPPFTFAGFQDLLYFAAGTTNAYAVFGQGKYSFTHALAINFGARIGTEKKTAATANTFNFAALPTGNPSIKSTAFTPKLGLQYALRDDVNTYASVTKGFKSGGINTIALTDEIYGPETLWSYEVGVKADWWERRVRTNVAAFYYDYRNMQVNTYSGLGTVVQNAGFATIKGAELEWQFAPVRHFGLDGQVSYLDGHFDKYLTINPDDPAAGEQDLVGYRLPRTPKWSYSAGATFDLDLSERFILSARGEYQWRAHSFYSQYQNPRVAQDAFSLVNANLTVKTRDGHYEMSIWGRNLSNTHWYAFVGGSPGLNGIQAIPAAPRTFGLTLTCNY